MHQKSKKYIDAYDCAIKFNSTNIDHALKNDDSFQTLSFHHDKSASFLPHSITLCL